MASDLFLAMRADAPGLSQGARSSASTRVAGLPPCASKRCNKGCTRCVPNLTSRQWANFYDVDQRYRKWCSRRRARFEVGKRALLILDDGTRVECTVDKVRTFESDSDSKQYRVKVSGRAAKPYVNVGPDRLRRHECLTPPEWVERFAEAAGWPLNSGHRTSEVRVHPHHPSDTTLHPTTAAASSAAATAAATTTITTITTTTTITRALPMRRFR